VEKQKLFFGWRVVIAGFFLAIGMGAQGNSVGLFVIPVTEALKFTRSQFMLILTIQSLVALPTIPILKNILKKYDIRIIYLVAFTTATLVHIGYAFSSQIWQFYVLAFVFGPVSPNVFAMALSTMIGRWFIEKRGIATGIAFSGTGCAGFILSPILHKAISTVGFRAGYLIIAGISFACMILAVILIRDKPEDIGITALGADKGEIGGKKKDAAGLTMSEGIRKPTFYLFLFAIFLLSMVGLGVMPHIVAYLQDVGYAPLFAAGILSGISLMMIFMKVGIGIIFDKLSGVKCALIQGIIVIAAMLLLMAAKEAIIIPFVFACFFASTYSLMSVGIALNTSKIFGDRDFPAFYSYAIFIHVATQSFASLVSAAIFDRFGSYYTAWLIYLVLAVLILVCLVIAAKQSRQWMRSRTSVQIMQR
jgi:predicted MFS family arabinose efflux permease